MAYRLDITFKGLKTVVCVDLIEVATIPTPPVQCIRKKGEFETIGYFHNSLKDSMKLLKSHARSKKEIPNLMYDFLAWNDAERIFNEVSQTHPEWII